MNQVLSVSVLYEYGMPGIKFHYQNGECRTLRDDEALDFVHLVESERTRTDINFLNVGRVRRFVANKYFH